MLLNRKRASELMEYYDVDVLVATLPENVNYFTGFASWICRTYKEWHHIPGGSNFTRQSYGIISRDESIPPSLVLPMIVSDYVAQFPSWIELENIYTYGDIPKRKPRSDKDLRLEEIRLIEIMDAIERNSPGPGLALVNLFQKMGLEGKIGVNMSNLLPRVANLMRKRFPKNEFRDTGQLIRLIRMVKTSQEIERLKNAAKINEKTINIFYNT